MKSYISFYLIVSVRVWLRDCLSEEYLEMPDSDSICRRSPTSQHEAKQQHRAENLASPSIADFNKPWSADVRSTSVTRLRCPQCETMDAIVDDLVAHLLHIYSRFHPSIGIAKPQLTTKISLLGRHFGATGFREDHGRITTRTFIFSSFLI